MQKNGWMVITGASGGIGREMAVVAAARGWNLVLVARSAAGLNDVAAEAEKRYGVQTAVLVGDLSREAEPQAIASELERREIVPLALVNNAGFGQFGKFAEAEIDVQLEMIRVNACSVVHLTRLLLPGMLRAGSGRILNVASTAGFYPGPSMAVYYATKAFAVSFSDSLRQELRGTDVSVTCLCPGPVRTGFQARAGNETTLMVRSGLLGWVEPAVVARMGYEGMVRRRRLVVPGLMNRLSVFSTRLLPRPLAGMLVDKLHEPGKR